MVRLEAVTRADDVPGGLEDGYALLTVSRPLAHGWLADDLTALTDPAVRQRCWQAAQTGLGWPAQPLA